MIEIQSWLTDILANPVTKQPCNPDSFDSVQGVIDARVFLRNTHGYCAWAEGQKEYENYACQDTTTVESCRAEIEYDRPIYQHYQLHGRILDCGGGAGSVREFLSLSDDIEFVSTDPWLMAPFAISPFRKAAYTCLNRPLNFIAATAEFQPFLAGSFDWVHMRSMLDHVQVPDMVLLEAKRVLRTDGRVLIGLTVEGGKSGVITLRRRIKDSIKAGLEFAGIKRWKDHHIWHPTYKDLLKLIDDNGFSVEDTFWQPHWNDSVCYVCARKID
jgi:SAM-dependent methyltransferase